MKNLFLILSLTGFACAAFADPHRDFFEIKKQVAASAEDPNLRVRCTQLALVTGNYKDAEEGLQWIRTNHLPDWSEWATTQTKYLPMLGKPAPDFQGKDLDGWTIKRGDFEGRVVLIHFWSVVDGLSQESLPPLMEIVRKYKNNPFFTIFSVSVDKDPGAVKQTVGLQKITWPQMFEGEGWNSPTAKAFQIQGTPALALIDSDGILRFVGSLGQMLNDVVEVAMGHIDDKQKAAASDVRLTPRSKDNKVFCVRSVEVYSPQNHAKVQSKLKPGALLTLGKPDPATGMITAFYDDPETGRSAEGLIRMPAESVK